MAILAASVIGLVGIVVGIALIRFLLLEPLLAEVRGRREASLHLRAPSIEFKLEVKEPTDAPESGADRVGKGRSKKVNVGGHHAAIQEPSRGCTS
jgi:hypothetical protein